MATLDINWTTSTVTITLSLQEFLNQYGLARPAPTTNYGRSCQDKFHNRELFKRHLPKAASFTFTETGTP